MTKLRLLLILGALVGACAPQPTLPAAPSPPSLPSETATPAGPSPTPLSGSSALWISPAVPDVLRRAAQSWGVMTVDRRELARITLDVQEGPAQQVSHWVYALVAPFPTVMDGVTSEQIKAAWLGSSSEAFGKWPLFVTAATREAFAAAWGAPGANVQVAAGDQMAESAWEDFPSWAIVPFESLEPRWKVLAVDGQSPLHKDFNAASYPLTLGFELVSSAEDVSRLTLPASNRDPARLSTLIMTGTTSLVREFAYQIEVKGLDYPIQELGDLLRQADLLHVSNEVSFDPTCPPPDPRQNRFYCSDPRYIGLFDDAGVDIVELTGNHILDNGARSMLYTLDLMRQHKMMYFGGGANLADARKPLLLESNGNKLAFLGCNAGEPPVPAATSISPGANPCDYPRLIAQIQDLRAKGYLPIVTFQYKEGYSPRVMPWQQNDFRRVAQAGAAIVSGSQSHVPMQMEFYGRAFIHYGLGNFFFGQMGNQPPGPGLPVQPSERTEFLDRHVFYDGRYLGTELLSVMLDDYARLRPMTPDERAAFLTAYFAYSGWLPFVPTPAPAQTPTRYPLLDFHPLPTHTPLAPPP